MSPTVADLVAKFRSPVNLPPSAQERCLAGALAEVGLIKAALPRYHVETLDKPAACPGQLLTITGANFGPAGKVVFPGAGPVTAQLWTDTRIQVVVPPAAAPGTISLSIFERWLRRCEHDFLIYRPGDTAPVFEGGTPQILSLWIDNVEGDTSAEPGAAVDVWFETTALGTGASLVVTDPAGNVVFASPALPGGTQALAFTAPPAPTGPVDLTVTLRAAGACGTAVRTATLTVTRQPLLRIIQTEITQAIQRLDGSVRLAAHRRTLLRLYLANGLSSGAFSYTGNPRELPNVTGSVTLWRGTQKLAVVAPTPATITSTFFFQPGGRLDPRISLNFWLPPELLEGPIQLEARVWLDPLPHGVLAGPHTRALTFLNPIFERTNHVRLVQVLLRDDWRPRPGMPAPPPGLPAPAASQWAAGLQGARTRLPFPDDGFEVYLPPGSPVIGTNHDLTTEDGWEFVLEDLDDIAEDTSNAWNYAWTGVIAPQEPGGAVLKLNGIGRKGNGEHDYPAMACQAGLAATFAHELVHVLGFGHAPCPPSGPDMPADIDSSLPGRTEDFGIDLTTLATFPANSGELMSYCDGEQRWISIVLWHKIMDLLKV